MEIIAPTFVRPRQATPTMLLICMILRRTMYDVRSIYPWRPLRACIYIDIQVGLMVCVLRTPYSGSGVFAAIHSRRSRDCCQPSVGSGPRADWLLHAKPGRRTAFLTSSRHNLSGHPVTRAYEEPWPTLRTESNR